eukprot:m.251899 g.251899  ORF g.251899 m.251899 type:complete len:446 (+) comp19548_c1_seq3:192-1529(+)
MSDDDFMCDSDQDYDFDYESDDGSEADADLENQYYNSKQLKEDNPEDALAGFAKVVDLESPAAEWGFKALKQTIKLTFRLGRFEEMMKSYRTLLTYIKSAVPRNYSEKSINNLMDLIATGQQVEVAQQFYTTTLDALKDSDARNDRLWFKAKIKLGKMYLDTEDYTPLAKLLKELEISCQTSNGADDVKKGTQLFEIFSLKFPMLTAQKNTKALKKEYVRALKIKSAIPHPLIMGIIRECGGKMHLSEEQWAEAYEDFFEAFKNYDESGSPRRLNCLKMLVLASMLMQSKVDPFDAQESKPYRDHPQIKAMTDLVMAYQANDIKDFEKILKANRTNLMDDPFIREYISDLLTNIRTEVLIKLIRPYTRVRIPFISQQLNIQPADVELLLRMCILDGRITGHIDQVAQLLVVEAADEHGMTRYEPLDKWSDQLEGMFAAVTSKLSA